MPKFDHLIIGSGINALVCAAILSQTKRVMVLEREDVVGGTMRTGELAPGFTYDPLATTFVLFMAGPAHEALRRDLAREGVTFSTTHAPTGALMANGRSVVLARDRAANVAALNAVHAGDGDRYSDEMAAVERDAALLFGLFNNRLWSLTTAGILAREAARRGPRGVLTVFGDALASSRRHLAGTFSSAEANALFAPWPLHAGLDPEQPFSGKMGQIIPFALERFGAPIVTGGSARMAEALVRIIVRRRGVVRTSADVDLIEAGTDGRSVKGVRLADGEEIDVHSVICSVTPTQLYGRLLREFPLPPFVERETRRYQYGRANMQIHYALDRSVAWANKALGNVQLLHLTDGVDQVSKACNEALRGYLPARPTVCVGQPTAADPSRAPEGKAVLWIQLPECPTVVKGDAAGEIEVPEDGAWTADLREAYADRVEAMIEAHVPGFRETVVRREAISPADLAATNINLVGGDPYAGWCGIDQFFTFRPFPQQVNHRTAVPDVYHIGASTHPGPGLGGVSGFLAAKALR